MSIGTACLCPACLAEGELGAPCATRGCARVGYRFVPEEAATKARERSDPMIGRAVGDYLIVRAHRPVAYGMVYEALHVPTGERAALKVIERNLGDPDAAERRLAAFMEEAAKLAGLRHPNVVKLRELGVHEGLPVLVTDFAEGAHSLHREMADRLRHNAPFHPRAILSVLHGILDALEAAHQIGIVHGGLSPERVLLEPLDDGGRRVRLQDFGFVSFVGSCADLSMALSSPSYVAPEQLVGSYLGPWTDTYAVGALVLELLTGARPFEAVSPWVVFARKLEPGRALARFDLPEIFSGFLQRALAPEPSERFPSCGQLRQALDGIFAPLIEAGGPEVPVELETVERGADPAPEPATPDPAPAEPAEPAGAGEMPAGASKTLPFVPRHDPGSARTGEIPVATAVPAGRKRLMPAHATTTTMNELFDAMRRAELPRELVDFVKRASGRERGAGFSSENEFEDAFVELYQPLLERAVTREQPIVGGTAVPGARADIGHTETHVMPAARAQLAAPRPEAQAASEAGGAADDGEDLVIPGRRKRLFAGFALALVVLAALAFGAWRLVTAAADVADDDARTATSAPIASAADGPLEAARRQKAEPERDDPQSEAVERERLQAIEDAAEALAEAERRRELSRLHGKLYRDKKAWEEGRKIKLKETF